MATIHALTRRYRHFAATTLGKRLRKWGRQLFLFGILAYLVYQFREIGWEKVWQAMPSDPLFYLLQIPIFFLLPSVELFIYRMLWGFRFGELWSALLIKKVYNNEVMGYAGEVYLYGWASHRLKRSRFDLVMEIKDNNVVSSVVSTLVTLLTLFIFLLYYPGLLEHWTITIPSSRIALGAIAGLVVGLLLYRFKHYILTLPWHTVSRLFGLHVIRHLLAIVLQVFQWHFVLPQVPMSTWFTFVAVHMVITRLPFIPNLDLLFISISIKVMQVIGAPLAAITAVMTLNSILEKSLHTGVYIYYQLLTRKTGKTIGETSLPGEMASLPTAITGNPET